MNPDEFVALIEHRAWVPAAALVVGLLVRLMKSDTKLPIDIPPRARAWVALGLGILSGVLEHVATGRTWTSAIVGGLVTGALAIIGHDTLIASLRRGRELPVPGLMAPPKLPSLANTPIPIDEDIAQ